MSDVLVVVGVGGMGQAIARRLGPGKTVLLADYNDETLQAVAAALSGDGYQVQTCSVDVSSAQSVGALARAAAALGSVTQVAHTAGLSPSQAPAAAILAVDLVGVALVLHEFAAVIAPGGAGVVIASMAGHLFPPLTPEQERAVIQTPTQELLALPFVSELTEPALAYGVAKRANHIQVQAAAKVWGAAWRQDQLDQSRDHLHADGSAGAWVPARRRHARDDRGLGGAPSRHTP